MNEKGLLLQNLSAVSFSMLDLHLFLNTHPHDAAAIQLFNQYRQKYALLKEEYEKAYGPLTAMDGAVDGYWKWVQGPWPWEAAANTEV